MSTKNLGILKATELEKSVSKSIYGRNKKYVDSYIKENLKNSDSNIAIPTIQVLVEDSNSLKNGLLELYDRKMALDDTSGISDEIKILQASLFDGLVFGINLDKGGEMAIYTANFGVIFSTDSDDKLNMSKTADMNREGIVNAIRVDIEYTSQEGFQFKPVALNKNTNLKIFNTETGEGRFHLVPYIVFQRYFVFFKEMLDSMRVLEVHQDKNGVDKVRYITESKNILNKYSDIGMVENSTPEYFPLKGFFYAPVVGAPSTTVGMTRIDLIDVFKVAVVADPKIEKSKDPYRSLIVESTILKLLEDLYANDFDRYMQLLESFPGSLGVEQGTVQTPVSVIKYLHGLKSSDISKVESLIPNLEDEIKNKEVIFDRSKFGSVDIHGITKDSLKEYLKTGVYKLVIRKKDCLYSSMIVTNSVEILKVLYGENYFGTYESIGTRLYKLEEAIKTMPKDKALELCGFDGSEDNVKKIDEAFEMVGPDMKLHEALERSLTGTHKKTTRRSTSNGELILARKCFASSSRDFYCYVDLNKIVSITRIG